MVWTSLRISELTGGRPGSFICDNWDQYRLKRLRGHEITVSGRTIIRADFQSAQTARKPVGGELLFFTENLRFTRQMDSGVILAPPGSLGRCGQINQEKDLFFANIRQTTIRS